MRLTEILLAWIGYFALHSLLAASCTKAWVGRRRPQWMSGYRIFFNAVATVTLLPVLWLAYNTQSAWLWQWQGVWAWVANAVALTAILCLFASARAYDMDEFLGLRQLREHGNDVPLTFTISPLHRFVRHPWYCIALVLVWSRDMNEAQLISALAITVYLFVGSWLEERKLIDSYGQRYRSYMAQVPGLIPLPWKYMSALDAATLVNSPGAEPSK
ncbi:MAG: hypothetical protein D4R84_04510 [Rhodocyclaceae bacterium]|nr:MAG: hypothetical protein D4R84_04510 [Rhodocyclaceae bacterium]